MISVIIPTRDRPGMLIQCLNGLYCQDAAVSEFEVIVVDDGSTYDVEELVRCHPLSRRVRTLALRNPAHGPAAARNAGFERSSGEVLAFLDDDAVPAPNWISVIEPALAAQPGAVVALTGRILPLQENLFSDARQARYDDRRVSALSTPGRFVNFLAAGNCAIYRTVFETLGGFDTRCTMMHDRELVLRLLAAGNHCVYEDGMVIHHMHVKELGDAFVNAFRSGGYRKVLEAIHPTERAPLGRDFGIMRGLVSKAFSAGSKQRRKISAVNAFLHAMHFMGYLTSRRKPLPPAGHGFEKSVSLAAGPAGQAGTRA
jgi:glycosyltransferase involved in cell wall biosynthesis